MDWIDKLNKDLEERREKLSTEESKQKAEQRKKSWIASQGGKVSGKLNGGKAFKKMWQEDREKLIELSTKAGNIAGSKPRTQKQLKALSNIGKKTWKENFKDTVEKRRSYKGEGNVKCTITEETAINILTDYVNEPKKYGLFIILSEKYNCSKRVVQKICTRETWKHIKPKE